LNAYQILNTPKGGYTPKEDFDERTKRALNGDKRTFIKDVTDTAAFVKQALPKIKTLLGTKKGRKVLDVGCGYGRHIPHIAPQVDTYVALEPCLQRVQYAKQHNSCPNVEILHLEVQKYKTRGRFDLIWMCNVIQHLPIGLKFDVLFNTHRLLKKTGKLLMWEGRVLDKSLEECAEYYLSDECPAHMIPMPFSMLEDEFNGYKITKLDPPAFILIERK
jgi:SAM-dependent methyltransferase